MIPFAVLKSDRPLQHGIAALEMSSGQITPIVRQASLNCIFDLVAESALTVSSPHQVSPLPCMSNEIIPDSKVEASTRSIKSNCSSIMDPKESQHSIKRSTSSKVLIQANFDTNTPIESDKKDEPIAFRLEDVQLESCCHTVASQMMKKIIDDFNADRNLISDGFCTVET